MKKTIFSVLLLTLSAGTTAHAEMKLESVRFVMKRVLKVCTDCQWSEISGEAGGRSSVSGNGSFHRMYVSQGNVVISEFDTDGLASRKTIIPAYIRVEDRGPALRFQERDAEGTFKIRNTSGKSIKSIFGTYRAVKTGVTAGIVGVGVQIGVNQNGVIIGGIDSLRQLGLGADGVYETIDLKPGVFQQGQQNVVLANQVMSNSSQQINQSVKSLNEILGMKVPN